MLCSCCFQLLLTLSQAGFPQRQCHWHMCHRSLSTHVRGGAPGPFTLHLPVGLRQARQTRLLVCPSARLWSMQQSLLPPGTGLKMSSPHLTRKMGMKHKAQIHELLLLSAFEELLCWTADRWMDRHLRPAVQGPMRSSSLETNTELN